MNRAKAAYLGIDDFMTVLPTDKLHYFRFDSVRQAWGVLVATNPVPSQTPLFEEGTELKVYVILVPFGKSTELPAGDCMFGAQEVPDGFCCVVGPKIFTEK